MVNKEDWETKIREIRQRYFEQGKDIGSDNLINADERYMQTKYNTIRAIHDGIENDMLNLDINDINDEDINDIIEYQNKIMTLQGKDIIDENDEDFRDQVKHDLYDEIESGYADVIFNGLVKYVEDADIRNEGYVEIPSYIKNILREPSEFNKKVTIRGNKIKEIKGIEVGLRLDASDNPITLIDVDKGSFLNIVDATTIKTLGFNFNLKDTILGCRQLVGEYLSNYLFINPDTDDDLWEIDYNELPKDVIDAIFSESPCEIAYKAAGMAEPQIAELLKKIVSDDQTEDDKYLAFQVVRRQHLPLIEDLMVKYPENDTLKMLHSTSLEEIKVMLGDTGLDIFL